MARASQPRGLFDLAGEVALVTGASSGLGARFAEVLADNGARVILAARRTDRLEALHRKIADAGGAALPVAMDVTDRQSIAAAFDAAEQSFGTVSVLINNAGIAMQQKVLEQTPAAWRSMLDTNLDGVWFCAQEGARRMVAAGREGSIVNIASILGLGVAKTLSAYAVAKAGVIQLTRAMALELAGKSVRVNAIAPGYVLTEINEAYFASAAGKAMIGHIPIGRIGAPEDLDGVLLLLASRASRFMTGSIIVIDGGHGLAIA